MDAARILIVEDDTLIAEALEGLLKAQGFEVELARRLSTARSLLAIRRHIDLLALNLGLSDGDGIDLLKEWAFSIPVVVITSDHSEDVMMRAFEAGATDFIVKPFKPAELSVRIRNIIARLHESYADRRMNSKDK